MEGRRTQQQQGGQPFGGASSPVVGARCFCDRCEACSTHEAVDLVQKKGGLLPLAGILYVKGFKKIATGDFAAANR